MRRRAVAGLAGLVLATTACNINIQAGPEGDLGFGPSCAEPDRLGVALEPTQVGVDATVVLMAQAVRTASSLPCIRSDLPAGWFLPEVKIRDGLARFWLGSHVEGDKAVLVQVTASCDVRGATEVPSEQTGMRQYERVTRLEPGYGGKRYYVYPGGCTTYEFDLHGKSRAQPVAAISQALGFITRDNLRQQVRDRTGGRLELDPGEPK
jgi:hypothetical protein